MQSQSLRSELPPPAPTMGDGAQAWSELGAAVRQRAELDARIIELTGEVQRSGTIETLEGVTLDTALNLVHRLPASERGMLLTAVDVLADMPETMALLKAQLLSWGQVRGIVAEAKRLSKDGRCLLDAHIGTSWDMFAKFDSDEAVDAVRIAAEEIRGLRAVERSADAVEKASFVWAQPGMFGPGKLYSQMDNLSLAQVLNGIDACTPADDGRPLSQRRADGLVSMANQRLAGTCDGHETDAEEGDPDGDGDGSAGEADDDALPVRRPVCVGGTRHPVLVDAKPSIDVIIDTRDVTITSAGIIQVNAPGCLPTLTARAIEALTADASVRVVLVDGGRPLTVTRKVRASDVPAKTRVAVKLRDRGDRFPGSRGPLGQVHLHHLDKDGAGHNPDAIVSLLPKNHRRVHRLGWKVTVDPPTGEVTFTRGERSWTTLPRGTRLRRPPPEPDPPDPPGDATLPF